MQAFLTRRFRSPRRRCCPRWITAALLLAAAAFPATAQVVFIWDAGGDGILWSDPDNWSNPTFNDYPRLSGDTALITGTGAAGTGSPPILDENITLGDLQILSSGDVFTGFFANFRFNVVNETLISGNGSSLTLLDSPSAVDLETNTLTVNSTGTNAGLVLSGGTARVDLAASINSGGAISGNGTLQLNSTTGNLNLNGTILVPEDDTLRIEGSGTNTGIFDWDGTSGTGVLNVGTNGRLEIDLPQGNDAFGGTMIVGFLAELDNASPWTLDTGGTIDFRGGAFGAPGIIQGGAVTSRGTIDAETGSGRFDPFLNVTGGQVVMGSVGGAHSQLSVRDGIIRNAATPVFNFGNLIVSGDFTIDQAGKFFDMDGVFNDNEYFVNRDHSLTINAATINPNTGSFTTNRYAGSIRTGGRFVLNGVGPDLLIAKLNPTDRARFEFLGDTDGEPSYDGVPIVFGGDSTFLSSEASSFETVTSRFDAPVRFDGGGIEIEPNATVIFTERVEFRGGSSNYTNTGGMRFQKQVVVNTTTPLTLPYATTFDATSSTTLINGATLNLNGPVAFNGGDFFGGTGRTVNLNGNAVVAGGTTTFNVETFNLDGTGLNTVTINAGATLDLNVTRIDSTNDVFDSTIDVAGTLDVQTAANEWFNSGTVLLNGGTITGDTLRHGGSLTSTGASRIDTSTGVTFFQNGSTTAINGGTLTLDGIAAVIEDTAGFSGNGTLVNAATSPIGDVDFNTVSIRNELNFGLIGAQIDPSLDRPVLVQANHFTQTAPGGFLLFMVSGSGGVPGADYSQLRLDGQASLDGRFTIDPVGTFTPALGDSLTLITATGGVTGQFGDATLPELALGNVWQIAYNANSVVLEVVKGIRGDYNDSGLVEQGDLDLVLANWGDDIRTTGIPTGWVNDLPIGLIEQSELDPVLANWGSAAAPDFGGHAVPEPAGLMVMVGLGLSSRVRRRGWC